jgi:hypothetical protein
MIYARDPSEIILNNKSQLFSKEWQNVTPYVDCGMFLMEQKEWLVLSEEVTPFTDSYVELIKVCWGGEVVNAIVKRAQT